MFVEVYTLFVFGYLELYTVCYLEYVLWNFKIYSKLIKS